MEGLPDELFVLIFRYLTIFAIICASNNPNCRFQPIINTYFHKIDVTRANHRKTYGKIRKHQPDHCLTNMTQISPFDHSIIYLRQGFQLILSSSSIARQIFVYAFTN
ncbi:hypothetical protein I4U23_027336 [Adineta vaga]|nr:hypothetical protein I4U23_027336 [Adineta vaga]